MKSNENNINKIVELKHCHSCGACIASCPFGAIKKDKNNIPKIQEELCVNCGICKRVCSGDGIDFLKIYEKFHGQKYDINTTLGAYTNAYLSYANDPDIRIKGTSGGFIKAFLISLLESSKIQGVVLISQDEVECFKAKAILATKKDEILNAGKSRYSRSLTLEVLKEIENRDGKFAVVGLPCQIHSLWKIRKLNSKIDNKILFTVGLFCHSQIEIIPERIIFKNFGLNKLNIKEYISRYGKHPGTPYVKLENDEMQPVYFPKKNFYRPTSHEILNIMYYLYTPKRCMYCFDGASELADISVGDPWIKNVKSDELKNINFQDGYSFVLARSSLAKSLIDFVSQKGDINLQELSKDVANQCNKKMLYAKKLQAWYFIKKENTLDYGKYKELIPNFSKKKLIKQKVSNLLHVFCFYPSIRDFIMKFILSNFGYVLLYINNIRRKFKK